MCALYMMLFSQSIDDAPLLLVKLDWYTKSLIVFVQQTEMIHKAVA
jgi:hypothetical protein